MAAAGQLADARGDANVLSGTAACRLGFEQDNCLFQSILDRTDIPAGSSFLKINDLFRVANVRRFRLVTPYMHNIQAAIIAIDPAAGLQSVGKCHHGEAQNFGFSEFIKSTISGKIALVVTEQPETIAIMCSNMCGARIALRYEETLGIPIFDSISAAVRAGLRVAGKDTHHVKGWGQMFGI